jgi:hypothetical protein
MSEKKLGGDVLYETDTDLPSGIDIGVFIYWLFKDKYYEKNQGYQ